MNPCFLIIWIVLYKKKCKTGEYALTVASQKGHLDVVSRLLECKEIDANLQGGVSKNVAAVFFVLKKMKHGVF